jgi:hypothetical protein
MIETIAAKDLRYNEESRYHEQTHAGKIGYSSRRNARVALLAFSRKTPHVTQLDVYRCHFCRDWHLGHKIQHKRRPRA